MTIVALDLSSRVGWAIFRPSTGQIQSGTIDLRRTARGGLFAAYRDWLMEIVIGSGATHIVREAPFLSAKTFSAAPLLYGLAAITEEVGARRAVPVHEVAPHEWRRFVIGEAMAPKTIAKAHRRAWLKDEARAACERRGIKVESHDEADAVGVLLFERARLYPRFATDGELGL